jgi:hypothetical protein
MGQADPSVGQSNPSGRSQPHTAGQPLEQRTTEVTFESLNLVGESWLGDVQESCRGSE